jgi:formylglycine-generating enzyme required for sulfatase activity
VEEKKKTAGTPPVTSPEQPPATPKLRTWQNPKDGLTYSWIPPGSFTMGCSPGDSECRDNEKPAHLVEIEKGYWMGQTEVTKDAYRRVTAPNTSPLAPDEANMPVTEVSWPQAKAYCRAVDGRLPTEAEWEYAARGGKPEPYYGPPSAIAWYAKNSGGAPHPVKGKKPNAFGLYDTLGNVSEWVLDRYYNKYYADAVATGDVDQPLPSNAAAVARGGFWDGDVTALRVSRRVESPNDEPVQIVGFRCASDHR